MGVGVGYGSRVLEDPGNSIVEVLDCGSGKMSVRIASDLRPKFQRFSMPTFAEFIWRKAAQT